MNKKILVILGGLVFLGGVAGLTVYLALHGGGEVDINGRIRATDQSHFTQPVLPDTRAIVPNGGLHPQGNEATPQPPSPVPVPAPVVASSTMRTASSTATSTAH